MEGEATASPLSKLLKPLGRAGDADRDGLEYADEVAVWKAMEGQREI